MLHKEKVLECITSFLKKEAVTKVFCNITAFLVLVVQSDCFFFNLGEKYRIIEYLILGFWFLILFGRLCVLEKGIEFLKSYEFRFLIIPIVMVFLSFLVNIVDLTNAHRHIFILFHLVLSPVILFSFDLSKLFKYFLVIFLCFCVVSDIVWVIDRVNTNLLSFLPVLTNKAYIKFRFYGLGFIEVHDYAGFEYRNSGLFREPGVYGVFLIISLIILFSKKYQFKKTIFNLIAFAILGLTCITTFSTTTILCFVLVIFLGLFRNSKINQPLTWIKISALVFLIGAFIAISIIQPDFVNNNSIMHTLFHKMFNKKSTSFYNRLYDSVSSASAILRNPITGNGWGVHKVISTEFASAMSASTSGGINSFFTIASVYGALFGFYVIKNWFVLCKEIFNNKLPLAIFAFVIIFIVLACEDMTNNFLFIFVPYSVLMRQLNKKYEMDHSFLEKGELAYEE